MNINNIAFRTLPFLQEEKVILYPTDTIWGIGCDAFSKTAIERIQAIKKRDISKNFILLVSSFAMLEEYVKVSPEIKSFLEKQERPTTVIYQEVYITNLPLAKDHSLAFRVVNEPFCHELIALFGRPIVSTSANISGESSPANFSQINPKIKKSVDYIVPYAQDIQEEKLPSQLVKIENDQIIFLRK